MHARGSRIEIIGQVDEVDPPAEILRQILQFFDRRMRGPPIAFVHDETGRAQPIDMVTFKRRVPRPADDSFLIPEAQTDRRNRVSGKSAGHLDAGNLARLVGVEQLHLEVVRQGAPAPIGHGGVHRRREAFPEAVRDRPGAVDAREGKVAVEGWSKLSRHDAVDMAQRFEEAGVEALVFTDIGRDGMMKGVNTGATRDLARQVNIPVIASGGVSNMDDVRDLCDAAADGVSGAIVGRALYEGKLDLAEAQKLANGLLVSS